MFIGSTESHVSLNTKENGVYKVYSYSITEKKLNNEPVYSYKVDFMIGTGPIVSGDNIHFVLSEMKDNGLFHYWFTQVNQKGAKILTGGESLYITDVASGKDVAVLMNSTPTSSTLEAVNSVTGEVKKLERFYFSTEGRTITGTSVYFGGTFEDLVHFQEIDFQDNTFLDIKQTKVKTWDLKIGEMSEAPLFELPKRVNFISGDRDYIFVNVHADTTQAYKRALFTGHLQKTGRNIFKFPE